MKLGSLIYKIHSKYCSKTDSLMTHLLKHVCTCTILVSVNFSTLYQLFFSLHRSVLCSTVFHICFRMKGTDASWEHNNEPPDKVCEGFLLAHLRGAYATSSIVQRPTSIVCPLCPP